MSLNSTKFEKAIKKNIYDGTIDALRHFKISDDFNHSRGYSSIKKFVESEIVFQPLIKEKIDELTELIDIRLENSIGNVLTKISNSTSNSSQRRRKNKKTRRMPKIGRISVRRVRRDSNVVL